MRRGAEPLLAAGPAAEVPFYSADLEALESATRDEELQRLATSDAASIDLSGGALAAYRLVRFEAEEPRPFS